MAFRVGIIGGTHFIGVHLIRALQERGDDVVALNRGLTRPPEPFLRPLRRVQGDRRDPAALDRLFEKPLDALFDTCGYVPADVAPVLSRRGRIGAYVFVSTSSVYRIPAPVPYDESAPVREDSGTYGGDKRRCEELILSASRPGAPGIVVRPQAVTGPWGAEQPLYALTRASAGRPVFVRAEHEGRKLCPLWVGDLVEAMLRAATLRAAAGRAFDLAGPDAVDPAGYVAAAARACGGRAETRRTPAAEPRFGLPWIDHDLAASGAAAREVLGIEPTPLAETLSRTWVWARAGRKAGRLALERGETDAASGRPVPAWRRASWAALDAAKAPLSAARRKARAAWT